MSVRNSQVISDRFFLKKRDVFCGVPIRLGASGVEQIVEVPLDPSEKDSLHASAKVVKEECGAVDAFLKAVHAAP